MVLDKLRSEGGHVEEERIVLADLYYEISQYTNAYEGNSETTIAMLN